MLNFGNSERSYLRVSFSSKDPSTIRGGVAGATATPSGTTTAVGPATTSDPHSPVLA
jgi:transcription elongation factor